jgi:transposase, IS5 family
MQKTPQKTTKMLLINTEEELFSSIIPGDHPFRKLNEIIDWSSIFEPLSACYSHTGAVATDIEKGMKALLIQFWEDYSDRQMEKAIKENMAIRWFCGFSLTEETPTHSYFSKLRERVGTKRIADLFKDVNDRLAQHGLFGNTFTFVDASAIVTKTALWKERDRAIEDGEEKLNNAVVSKYATDKDARWGAKSKKKIWFGYKRHEAVDMRYGLVKKVATTPANVGDDKVMKNIKPKAGTVFSDKLYDTKKVHQELKAFGLHPSIIQKRNNPDKNRELDRWRSGIRMPFEGVFSKRRKRAKFRSLVKVTMQSFMEVTVHNLKKAINLVPGSAYVST